MTDMRLAGGRRWFVYHCYEGDDSADAELRDHTQQLVTVLRKLTAPKVDEFDVGRMYRVRFHDGFEYDVFNDELVETP